MKASEESCPYRWEHDWLRGDTSASGDTVVAGGRNANPKLGVLGTSFSTREINFRYMHRSES